MNDIIFGKKVIEDKMWVYIFYKTFIWKVTYSKKNEGNYD